MRKFESSQKDESRAQLADSSKAYKKRKAFCWLPCNKIWKYFSNICVYLKRLARSVPFVCNQRNALCI